MGGSVVGLFVICCVEMMFAAGGVAVSRLLSVDPVLGQVVVSKLDGKRSECKDWGPAAGRRVLERCTSEVCRLKVAWM